MNKISFKEPGILLLGLVLSILSAAICMQIMGQFGIAPNTSLISAVLVMIIARIPLSFAMRFKNIHRQNLILSIASSSGFAAANCGFIAIATVFILGRNDLILPMVAGSLIGSLISVFMIGKIFDSRIFPAKGAWPLGTAIASSLEAGKEGGKKGIQLLQGLCVGVIASIFNIPAAGIGIAFVANHITMIALGIGVVIRGYSHLFIHDFYIQDTYIAQGMMIGAGFIALVQIFFAIIKGSKKAASEFNINDKTVVKTLVSSTGLFFIGALFFAFISGILSDMGVFQIILWLLFTSVAAIIVLILVGTASMHSGWAPTFAVVTIFMTLGIALGFPPISIAVLVGFLGSTGPCLADTAIGLKAGWILRGGEDEEYGRKQQIIIKMIGVIIGIIVALITSVTLLQAGVRPPMSIFYAISIDMPVDISSLAQLAIWAVPGMILQIAFGQKSVGLMLAAGLLIQNPIFGITVLCAVIIRIIIGTKHMTIRAPGLIAGDGLFGFVQNIIRAFL